MNVTLSGINDFASFCTTYKSTAPINQQWLCIEYRVSQNLSLRQFYQEKIINLHIKYNYDNAYFAYGYLFMHDETDHARWLRCS